MRIARTLALALAAAIAALALSASAASAASALELTNEHTLEHCNFAERNCEIVAHSVQETVTIAHVFGFEVQQSECEDEFTGYVGEDGSGHIVNQVIAQHPNRTCGKQNCTANGEGEWPFTMEEDGGGTETMHVEFCLQNLDGTGARHCTINVDVHNLGHDAVEFVANDRECEEGLGEVTGHWVGEPEESDEIRLHHLDDEPA